MAKFYGSVNNPTTVPFHFVALVQVYPIKFKLLTQMKNQKMSEEAFFNSVQVKTPLRKKV